MEDREVDEAGQSKNTLPPRQPSTRYWLYHKQYLARKASIELPKGPQKKHQKPSRNLTCPKTCICIIYLPRFPLPPHLLLPLIPDKIL